MRATTYMLAVAALLILGPATADAQWSVQPFAGGNFNGAFGQSFISGHQADTQPSTIGATGGWTHGWFGAEADFAYSPRFFDNDRGFVSKSGLWTLMGNGTVQLPWSVGKLRPYGSAGAGIIHPNLAEPGGLAEVNDAKLGWNAGGGALRSVSTHAALRGDVRYFRAREKAGSTNAFGIDFDGFDFWRAAGGVVFSW
jgi:hypothetical protein